ncbi:MAG: hypothetical protein ACRERR_14085 [Moraxellaceae bacterium]
MAHQRQPKQQAFLAKDRSTYGPDSGKKIEGSCESRKREHGHNEARKENGGHQMKGSPQGSPFLCLLSFGDPKESEARCSRNPSDKETAGATQSEHFTESPTVQKSPHSRASAKQTLRPRIPRQ